MFKEILENRKLKSQIRALELELEHERKMKMIFAMQLSASKNCAHSLCIEVRPYTYGRRAVNRYEQKMRSI